VAPADAAGPDGRRWVELALRPGDSAQEHLAVTNLSEQPVTFALSAADGYFTPSGRFSMLDDPSASTGAGTWIDLAGLVRVEPGQTVVAPFNIAVPDNAEPGDHAAGVAASVLSQAPGGAGSGLGVNSRFGFRVMTRVLGRLAPGLEVSAASVRYLADWNPARPGRARVGFDLANTGNTRLEVAGTVALGGSQAAFPGSGQPVIELLPGESRRFETTLAGVWPLGRLTGQVRAEPTVLALAGAEAPPLAPAQAALAVWALPWPQLAALALAALLLSGLGAGRARSRRRRPDGKYET
jgi:hypothetical protein